MTKETIEKKREDIKELNQSFLIKNEIKEYESQIITEIPKLTFEKNLAEKCIQYLNQKFPTISFGNKVKLMIETLFQQKECLQAFLEYD